MYVYAIMTKTDALVDAKARTERTGIAWRVIRIKKSFFQRPSYDTVSDHHLITHKSSYKSGLFKSIERFEPSETLSQ